MGALKKIKKLLYSFSAGLNMFGVMLVILMVLFIMVDVLGRMLFDKPLNGGNELVEYTMILVIAFALGYTQVKKGHTDVTTLLDLLPKKPRRVADFLCNLLCFATFALITWQTFVKAGFESTTGTASAVLHIAKYPFVYLSALGFAVVTLIYLIQAFLPDDDQEKEEVHAA